MSSSISSGHKYNVRLRILCNLLALIAGLFSAQVRALHCEFTDIFTDNITIPVIGSGISTAGEDTPVGTVLYSQTFTQPVVKTFYECSVDTTDEPHYMMNVYTRTEVASTPSGPAKRDSGNDIFPTNISGIGAIFYIWGVNNVSAFPDTWERTIQIGYGTNTLSLGQFLRAKIELIKTGPIAPGVQQVQGAALPAFRVISGSNSPFVTSNVFVNLNFTGVTTVHTKTCQLATSDIEVNLGSHDVSGFNSTGKTTEWKNFDIVLQGCPPFYGYGDYKYTEATGKLTGANTDNVASIVFRSANGVVEGNPLLARLDSSVNAATGVGIELSRRDNSESIAMDGSGGFNLPNLLKEDNATYIIPLKARYVQTETTVKPGLANGSVVFTITYL